MTPPAASPTMNVKLAMYSPHETWSVMFVVIMPCENWMCPCVDADECDCCEGRTSMRSMRVRRWLDSENALSRNLGYEVRCVCFADSRSCSVLLSLCGMFCCLLLRIFIVGAFIFNYQRSRRRMVYSLGLL